MALLAHCVSYGVNALYEKADRYGGPGISNRSSPRQRRPVRTRGPAGNGRSRLEADGRQLSRPRPGALYQVYASPGEITDVALEAGEQLVGSGPVAAGDTVRWVIGDTESGTGAMRQVHILIKPTRPDLVSNLIINTDRRTYHLELRSAERTYMASVSWAYAGDQLIALRRQNAVAEAAAPVASGVDIDALNFRYAIEGDGAAWRPLRAFDDGRQVFIEFPRGISRGEMPPL
jgi:type IV secretion system protein VirB9